MPFPSRVGSEIALCPVERRRHALEVLYRRVPDDMRPGLVADALAEASGGELDLSGLWVGYRRGRVVATLLTQRLAGQAAGVWPPEVAVSWGRSGLAAALVRTALADLGNRGIRIAQALVDESSPPKASADLARGGLPRVTDLTYMARATSPPLPPRPGAPELRWLGFGDETEAEFRRVLEATYEGSLDMPELEGIRSLDDVLAGHRAGGRFDPGRWQVGLLPGEPRAAAILLLNEPAERDCWEISYLGLTPEARGRGLGRASLARALDLARARVPRLELAVDARNHPAERLYHRAGFLPVEKRAVHLALLGR